MTLPQDDGKSDTTSSTTAKIVQASSMPEFNINENWVLWSERLEMHFLEIGCTSESSKISTLLKTIGSEAYSILHSICSPDTPCTKKYTELCEIMKQQFTTPVIVFSERKRFYDAKMEPSETVAAWYARLKKLAIDCNFGDSLGAIARINSSLNCQPIFLRNYARKMTPLH